jgi:hypothetical protein
MTRMTQAGSWSGWLSIDGIRVELEGKVGWGALEQLAIGPHVSGLTGTLTPFGG